MTSAFTIGDKVTTPSGNLDTVVFSDINRTFAYEALTDECIKLVPALIHYRKYRWVRNVTRSAKDR